MKRASLLVAALLAGCAQSPSSQPTTPGAAPSGAPPLVLGTFDSRALAIAYYRSEAHAVRTREAVAAHARAQDAGDAATAQRIDAEMRALQALAHRQGFGGAPIPELLAMIEDEIPAIARRAGVNAVVHQEDLLWLDPDAEVVDLSLALAEAFAPSDETRRMLPEVLKQKPVPLDRIED